MHLSIAIVNWNTRELLSNCLESIYSYPPACPYNVIVVDNASSDGSSEMVRQHFPQVCLIDNQENAGFAKATNQAIRIMIQNMYCFSTPIQLSCLMPSKMVDFMDE
jgi:GT2 family glycosyltransferase